MLSDDATVAVRQLSIGHGFGGCVAEPGTAPAYSSRRVAVWQYIILDRADTRFKGAAHIGRRPARRQPWLYAGSWEDTRYCSTPAVRLANLSHRLRAPSGARG
jgi:hypothetical protein